MLYKSYKNKIEKIAKIIDIIKKYKVLILSVVGALLAMLITFLSVKGIVTEDFSVSTTQIVYGESVTYSADALFSKTYYEFREKDSNEWQEGTPSLAGEYFIRAYSKKAFGIKNYSEIKELKILKKQATISIKENVITYGETPKVNVKLVKGDKLSKVEIDFEKTTGNVLMKANKGSIKILSKDGEEVTDSYEVATPEKEVFVNKKDLVITVPNKQKVYDGVELSSSEYSVDGLVFDDKESIVFSKRIINVGEIENSIDYSITRSGEDVTDNYNVTKNVGKLKITKRNATLTVSGGKKVYDGASLHIDEYEFTNLAKTDQLEISFPKTATNVWESGQNVPVYTVRNSQNENVTNNYNITEIFGNLTITKRDATLTVVSKDKVYDGNAFSSEEYVITNLANTDRELITFNKSITGVGKITNTPSVEIIREGTGENVKDNYNLTEDIGYLEITKRPITLTANSFERSYNNKPLTKKEFTITAGSLAPSQQISNVVIEGAITDVGSVDNVFKSVTILDKYGVVATSNYEITLIDGKLTVTKRKITISSILKEKIYDDSAFIITESDVLIGAEGLSEGQSFELRTNSSIVFEYGKDQVTYKIYNTTDKASDKSYNYDIEFSDVKLKITKRSIIVTAKSKEKTYDGTPLTSNEYAISGDGLVSGHEIFVTFSGSALNVKDGAVTNLITVYDIRNSLNSVIDNYDVTAYDGTLKILPCPIEISIFARKTYDDETIDFEDVEVVVIRKIDGIKGLFGAEEVAIDGYILETDREYVDAGEYLGAISVNQSTVSIRNGQIDNYDITYIAGDIIIDKRQISVSTNSVTEVYNRQTIFDSRVNVINGSLCTLHEIEVVSYTKLSIVDAVKNNVDILIKKNGIDKTKNYDILKAYGTLTLTKRKIVVLVKNKKVIYDGFAKTFDDIEFTYYKAGGDGLLNGDSIVGYNDYIATSTSDGKVYDSTIVDAGEYKITAIVDMQFLDNSYTDYYDIIFKNGDFTILKQSITIITEDISKTNEPITIVDTKDSYRISEGEIADTDSWSVEVNSSLATIGTAKNNISSITIDGESISINGDGKYEFKNYVVTVKEGTLSYNQTSAT